MLAGVDGLNLEDDDDNNHSPPPRKERSFRHTVKRTNSNNSHKRSPVKTTKQEVVSEDALQRSIAKLDPEMQSQVNKMLDIDTPMKERLSVEIKLMKHPDPEVRQIISDIRYRIDNQSFLVQKRSTQQDMDAQLSKIMSQEAVRAAQESKDLKDKQTRIAQEKRAETKRDKELTLQIRTQTAKSIVEDAERLRQDLEVMRDGTKENKNRKIQQEKEVEQAIQDFRQKEGKHLTPTERVLKEALIEQRETKTADQFD